MKLYYSPGACSLAVHLALAESGAAYDLEKVDLKTKTTESGADFSRINPNGYVPAVELDDGQILFEAPAVLQYLADRAPEAGLAPAPGTFARAKLQQYLNFTAAELHKAFSPLFAATPPEGAARDAVIARIASRLDFIEATLADGRPHLLGETFTIADAYTYVVAGWALPNGIGLDRWPHVAAYVERIGRRPKVIEARRREGLTH